MTIRAVTLYEALCDLCNKTNEDGDTSAYRSAEQAREMAGCVDWCTDGGNLVCPVCREKDTHLKQCAPCVKAQHDRHVTIADELGLDPEVRRRVVAHLPGCPVPGCDGRGPHS